MYDTLIIGAGMSGLAAGIRLAYYDQRVCILERHTTIGGLNSFYRLDGRNYDVGLHAVTNYAPKGTRRGPLARLLKQLRFQWDEFSLSPQIGSVIAFQAYLHLVARVGADSAGFVGILTPLVALTISTFFENYTWTWQAVLGVALILSGNILALIRTEKLKQLLMLNYSRARDSTNPAPP